MFYGFNVSKTYWLESPLKEWKTCWCFVSYMSSFHVNHGISYIPLDPLRLKDLHGVQGGPPISYNWGEITPISKVITPVTHLFSAIYRGYFTPFITIAGAHLVVFGMFDFSSMFRGPTCGRYRFWPCFARNDQVEIFSQEVFVQKREFCFFQETR